MSLAIADGTRIEVGMHTLSREGPVLHVVTRGDILLPDIEQMLAQYEAMIAEQGYALILIFAERETNMAMNSRRMATEWGGRRGHCVRSAIYGASFFMRTAIELLNRATSVLTRNAPRIAFFATDKEARAWLLAQIPLLTATNVKT